MSGTWVALVTSCGAIVALAGAALGGAHALRASLGVALALGTSGTAMSVSLFAGAPLGVAAALSSALGVGVALAFALTTRWSVEARTGRVPRWLVAVFGVSVALAALAVARRAALEPAGGWDAYMIWNLRARMLYAFAHDVRAAFPPEVITSQPDYPVLLPSLVVQGWSAAGGVTGRVPLALSVAIGVAAAGVSTAGVAAIRGPGAALLVAALLATTPAYVGATGAQYADQLVALFIAASAIAAWHGLERERAAPHLLALAGLFASFAAWSKNEGALFAVALALGIALRDGTRLRQASLRPLIAYAAGAAPVLALWAWFRIELAPQNVFLHDSAWTQLTRAADPARLAAALVHVARRLVYFQAFGLHLAAAVVVLVVLARRGLLSRPAPRALAVALGVAWLGFLATYVVSPFDVKWLVQHSADRLILQYWPFLLFLLFSASRPPVSA